MNRNSQKKRAGAAAVEAALMLPLLVITTFGAIDIAQYINAAQVVSNSSREGGRVSSQSKTQTTDEVKSAVTQYFADAFPELNKSQLEQAVDVQVRKADGDNNNISGGNLSSINSGGALRVNVSFDFAVIRWLSGPAYQHLSSETYCRRE